VKIKKHTQLLTRDFDDYPASSSREELGEDSLSLEPVEMMWAAVLQQMMEDATAPETSVDPSEDKALRTAYSAIEVQRRQARAIIFSSSTTARSHFADICEVVKLDPDYVKRRVADMIRHGVSFKRTIGVPDDE
jgi:hypothetical protein